MVSTRTFRIGDASRTSRLLMTVQFGEWDIEAPRRMGRHHLSAEQRSRRHERRMSSVRRSGAASPFNYGLELFKRSTDRSQRPGQVCE
jgi:hypothetical protein